MKSKILALSIFLLFCANAHASLKDWSTTAADNATVADNPNLIWTEGQAPSTVNNSAREMMADTREWYESAQWIDYGYTPVYISGTQFRIASQNVTSVLEVGRRIKIISNLGTVYGTITASTFSTDTTITVSLDSGSFDVTISDIAVGIISYNSSSELRKYDTQFLGTTGGTSAVFTINPTRPVLAYGVGQKYLVNFNQANTLSSSITTLNISGLGARTIKKYDYSKTKQNLAAGDLLGYHELYDDGTDLVVLNLPLASSAEVVTGTDAYKAVTPATLASAISGISTTGNLKSIQTFTASGTYTRPAGVTQVLVQVVGGGGGSSGAGGTSSFGSCASAGGGGAGSGSAGGAGGTGDYVGGGGSFGLGGNSFLAGGGRNNSAGAANTGGGGCGSSAFGGGAGGFTQRKCTVSATETVTIGAGGSGTAGGSGVVIVYEYS